MSDPLVTEVRLNLHEQICAERYGEIKEAFKAIHDRLNTIMYGMIGLLLAMVGWLLSHGVPWKV